MALLIMCRRTANNELTSATVVNEGKQTVTLVAVFVASKREKMNLARVSISPTFSAVPMQSSFCAINLKCF
jgi:hypothetical protein